MKKIFIFLFVLLNINCTRGQTNERDSLKQLLQKEKTDTGRVLLLSKLSFEFLLSQPDTAMLMALEALKLSKSIGFKKGEAGSLNGIGNAFEVVGNYPKAMESFLQALKINEEINNIIGVAQNLNNIGLLFRSQGNYRQALEYALKVQALVEKVNDKRGITIAFVNIGADYYFLKIFDSATLYAQRSYNVAKGINYYTIMGNSLTILGDIYLETGQNIHALENYRLSISYAKKSENDVGLGRSYLGIAKVFEKIGQKDSSLYYARQSLIISQDKKFIKEFLDASSFLSSFYKNRHNMDSAFFYLEVAKSTNDSLFSQQNIRQIQSLSFDEKFRQQDIENEKKQAENQIRTYIFIGVLFIFLLVAFSLWRNNRVKQTAYILLQKQKRETDFQKTKVEEAFNELKITQSQLIQSEKMASLGELTAGIAHEIQNPLNFVNNFSEVNKELVDELQSELKAGNSEEAIAISNDIKENEEKINHHGKRADSIVKGMLQHSRSSTGVKEETNINALADEYLRLAYHGLRAKDKDFNATMETNFNESTGNVNIIPQEIGRVLLNLYNNAFYAVNEKQKLIKENYQPTILVSTKKINDKVILTVKDNGNGIPQSIVDKIFQPFFTTKPTGQGTGLGLSLSYDIIKAHGGEIKLNTKEDEGAEFIIRLPLI